MRGVGRAAQDRKLASRRQLDEGDTLVAALRGANSYMSQISLPRCLLLQGPRRPPRACQSMHRFGASSQLCSFPRALLSQHLCRAKPKAFVALTGDAHTVDLPAGPNDPLRALRARSGGAAAAHRQGLAGKGCAFVQRSSQVCHWEACAGPCSAAHAGVLVSVHWSA